MWLGQQHQAIAWTYVYSSSAKSHFIHLGALPVSETRLKTIFLVTTWSPRDQWVKNWLFVWRHHLTTILSRGQWFKSSLHPPPKKKKKKVCLIILFIILPASVIKWIRNQQSSACPSCCAMRPSMTTVSGYWICMFKSSHCCTLLHLVSM